MFKEKIKSLIQKEKGEEKSENNKKKIENLVVLVIILIITVIVINLIWNGDNGEEKKPTSDPNKKLATTIEEGITEETVQVSSSSLYKIEASACGAYLLSTLYVKTASSLKTAKP